MKKKDPKIKIFVAHHKPGYIYEDDVYVPIQVGKKNAKIDLGILGDDTGDNISEKNDNYAELTAQYWVRKNYDLRDVDYVGFCHYRRYLKFKHSVNIKSVINIVKHTKGIYKTCCNLFDYIFGYKQILNFDKFFLKNCGENTFKYISKKRNGIFLDKAFVSPFYKEKPLKHLGLQNGNLWNILEKLIIKKYPNFQKSLTEIQNIQRAHYCNMFVMKKEIFLEYSERLFGILIELENEIINKGQQNLCMKEPMTAGTRFMGCLGERLLNLYVYYKKEQGCKISRTATMIFFQDV